MLLPSILRLLDQNDTQWNSAEAKKGAPSFQAEETKKELEIAAAAQSAKPSDAAPQPNGTHSPFMEELLRAINKFEKGDETRIVDVFE